MEAQTSNAGPAVNVNVRRGGIWLLAAVLVPFVATPLARSDDASCWPAYQNCALQAAGDATWRAVCYADFASCAGTQPLPQCPASGMVETCTAYRSDCEALFAADPEQQAMCADDAEVCLFAHGC